MYNDFFILSEISLCAILITRQVALSLYLIMYILLENSVVEYNSSQNFLILIIITLNAVIFFKNMIVWIYQHGIDIRDYKKKSARQRC